jgi:hypothetical protein
MAAPKGNQNAKGNVGGKTKNDRELAARVRSLALTQIEAALKDDTDIEFKKELLLKLATGILPRLTEVTGKDGGPVQVQGVEIAVRR